MTLRLRSNWTIEEQALRLVGVTRDSLLKQLPLFNAGLQLRDTTGRGWEAARRIEVAGADKGSVCLYARTWELDES